MSARKIAWFGAMTAVTLVLAGCQVGSEPTPSSSSSEASEVVVGTPDPLCADYLLLDEAQQLEIVGVLAGDWEWSPIAKDDGTRAGAFRIACEDEVESDDTAPASDAGREIQVAFMGDPIAFGRFMGRAPDYSRELSMVVNELVWRTETQGGNRATLLLRFAAPSNYVSYPEFNVHSACSFDPTTDVYSYGNLYSTNESSVAAVIRQRLQISIDPGAPVTISVVVNYAGGPQCVEIAGTGVVAASSSTQTTPFVEAPLDAGDHNQLDMFIIVHNYFSAAFPEGNVAALTAIRLQGTEVVDSSDPDATIDGSVVDLTGATR